MVINPIKENRIVNDITFAIRFRDFIRNIEVNDPASDEEKCYLVNVAQSLLDYQIKTATSEIELNYLKHINMTWREEQLIVKRIDDLEKRIEMLENQNIPKSEE